MHIDADLFYYLLFVKISKNVQVCNANKNYVHLLKITVHVIRYGEKRSKLCYFNTNPLRVAIFIYRANRGIFVLKIPKLIDHPLVSGI